MVQDFRLYSYAQHLVQYYSSHLSGQQAWEPEARQDVLVDVHDTLSSTTTKTGRRMTRNSRGSRDTIPSSSRRSSKGSSRRGRSGRLRSSSEWKGRQQG